MSRQRRREAGIVLPLVLIIAILLSAAIITFVTRSVVDGLIVRNRDRASQADALARGGIQLAIAVLVHDRVSKKLDKIDGGGGDGSNLTDTWARLAAARLETTGGGWLQVRIEDAGARLNLNALVPVGKPGEEGKPKDEAEEFLVAFLEKILAELELKTEARLYDAREMARNLLDYIDVDDVAIGGRREDDYYNDQSPPYSAPNRPLLSVDEIAMVEGFDVQIVEAMRPYVTVYPLVGDAGININTAPPHVLALLYHGSSGDMRLSTEDTVRQIMRARQVESLVCSQTEAADRCVTLSEVGLGEGGIYPAVTLPIESTVFLVTAEATFDDITRSIEAVIDVSNELEPLLLSWKAL